MALYCYIVETGYYEDRESNILGHETKYSQEEFDKKTPGLVESLKLLFTNVRFVYLFISYLLIRIEERIFTGKR